MRSVTLGILLSVSFSLAVAEEAAKPPPRIDGSCWPNRSDQDPLLCPPNDPTFRNYYTKREDFKHWDFLDRIPEEIDLERLHPAEKANGSVGISLVRAWQHTTGRSDVVIAVLDSGILWNNRDLVRKFYLNQGELPLPEGSRSYDRNEDGLFNVQDYDEDSKHRRDSRVADRNDNGILDPQDLIRAFSDCRDDDGNGYPDDISGYDFFGRSYCNFNGGDNDPDDETRFGHGTGIAGTAANETNNGIGSVGVCPKCMVLPVRVGDSFVVDGNQFARGLVFATRAGATVAAAALGSYNNTPAARRAIDLAYESGVALIASAADEYAYHHNYPSVLNHALYVNAIRDASERFTESDAFWALNPCSNFGPRVWVSVPARSCSSGATSRLAGVAGLVQSMALDSGLGRLGAEEVYQVLRASADDLDNSSPDWQDLRYPAKTGFDQYHGYGRVNALRAVEMVKRKEIPPTADLQSPDWFSVISPIRNPRVAVEGRVAAPRSTVSSVRLDYALGVEPLETDYVPLPVVSRPGGSIVSSLDFTRLPLPSGPSPSRREERDRYSVTLRLTVLDAAGRRGEARRSFFVFHDRAWKAGFPIRFDVSGEAAPVLSDLNGDGKDEIILPLSDGTVRIIRSDGHRLRDQRMFLRKTAPLGPGLEDLRETTLREVVIAPKSPGNPVAFYLASREGTLYGFTASGESDGFRKDALPPKPIQPAPHQIVEKGFLAAPVIAELDGRQGYEILLPGLDGYLYAWHEDGKPLEGFPLLVANPRKGFGPSKLISQPSVGDVDGDGSPEIVIGSNQVRTNDFKREFGALYAIRSRGNLDRRGAYLAGWDPLELEGNRVNLLPTVARGVTMKPILLDIDGDGDDEVVANAITGDTFSAYNHSASGPQVFRDLSLFPDDGSNAGSKEYPGNSFWGGMGSSIVTDTNRDGNPEIYSPLLPTRMVSLRFAPGTEMSVPPAIAGWEITPDHSTEIPMMRNFPKKVEDITLLSAPAAIDLNGDGKLEIVAGTGGYLLHGFTREGEEAAGFPKFTGGWLFSTPTAGDFDGDGRDELFAITREGYLFAWELDSP